MSERTIGVVTGTRAEYGILYWLLKDIDQDPDLVLQIFATGMHLSPEFGHTIDEIEHDGFSITARIEMLLSSDTAVGTAKSMGMGVIGFADAFERHRPDVVVMLGDRFELMSAAQAALIARIPIAHLHGGETTEGAFDEAIRHSLTKMSAIHFVAAGPYRQRVIQMGEHPDRVFNVGALGVENIYRLKLLDREEFKSSIDFDFESPTFLVTFHPPTLSDQSTGAATQELLRALDRFPEASIIFTKSNADPEGRKINQMIETYSAEQGSRTRVYDSLGKVRYLSALQHVDAVIGNSSSGLIEVPATQTPTVNIGERQKGRLRASSVIDCAAYDSEIVTAIRRALSNEFQESLADVRAPYGCGNTAGQIIDTLRGISLSSATQKSFFDLPIESLIDSQG